MYVTFTPQMLPLLASGLIGLMLASYGWRHRRAAGAVGFTAFALALVEISLVEALTLSVAEPAYKIGLQQLGFIGQMVAPTAWLAFVLRYTGAVRHSAWRMSALLALEPTIALVLALTNSAHGLVWQSVTYDGQLGNGVEFVSGPLVWFINPYAYGAGSIGTGILGWKLYRSRRLNWRQVSGLAVAIAITAIGESGLIEDLIGGLDPTPYILCGSGLALYWGFLHYRLLELSSIARDAAFESMTDGVIVLDPFGNVAEFNPIAAVVAGLPPETMLGRSLAELIASGSRNPMHDLLNMDSGTAQLTLNEGAAERQYEVEVSRLRHGAQRLPARLVVFRDVTERRLAEAALRESMERFRLQYRDSPIPTYSWRRIENDDFVLEDHNDAAGSLTDLPFELQGMTASEMFRTVPGLHDEIRRCWSERTKGQSEWRVSGPGGLGQDLAITFAFIPPDRVIVHAQDVTASKQARLELEHQAHHDALTGLPNRALLYERLSAGIARANSASSHMALLVLDLDRFKDVNDTLGHSAGDVLLQQIAARLQVALRSSSGEVGLAARIGGDEFAVLLENVDERGATLVANLILETLRAPLELEGHLVSAASGGQPVGVGSARSEPGAAHWPAPDRARAGRRRAASRSH